MTTKSDAPPPALGELARLATEELALVRSTASDYAEAAADYASPFASNPAGLRQLEREAHAAFTAACDAVEARLAALVALATGGAAGQQQDLDKTAKAFAPTAALTNQPQAPEPSREAIMCACGHRHRGRCRHRVDPHFYERRGDAPRCTCPSPRPPVRGCVCAYPCNGCEPSLTPERPADAD